MYVNDFISFLEKIPYKRDNAAHYPESPTKLLK